MPPGLSCIKNQTIYVESGDRAWQQKDYSDLKASSKAWKNRTGLPEHQASRKSKNGNAN